MLKGAKVAPSFILLCTTQTTTLCKKTLYILDFHVHPPDILTTGLYPDFTKTSQEWSGLQHDSTRMTTTTQDYSKCLEHRAYLGVS